MDYQASIYDAYSDFPINWLPANNIGEFDYSSILGLGISSSGLFAESMNYQDALSYAALDGSRVNDTSVQNHQPVASPAQTSSTASHHSFEPVRPADAPGGLYVTSTDGGRAPCTTRSKPPSTIIYRATPLPSVEDINANEEYIEHGFPDVSHITTSSDSDTSPAQAVLPETYDSINFPPIEHFNLFVRLFFEQFNSIFPVVHETSSDLNEYWPLALAIAAIGSQYTRTREFSECVLPMHEFLRRITSTELEASVGGKYCLGRIQAVVLSQVGMLYYGHSAYKEIARVRHGALVRLVTAYGLLQEPPAKVPSFHQSENVRRESSWDDWIEEESKRRLGYAIWLLDSMSMYHFGTPPLLSLEVALSQLPNDTMWEAAEGHEWQLMHEKHDKLPSLVIGVRTLFVEKKVAPNIGEFGRILLLHGVYQELYHVKTYLDRPLSAWIPSAQKKHSENGGAAETPLQSLQQPPNPSLASWRNASLDCVDVLHWAANGTIARFSGSEHPTVFHLHMSRIVLLAPYEAIQTLARSIASLAQPRIEGLQYPTREQASTAELEILQWAQRDEHKARLCMIHCGCLLWHVRRYSTMAFYEPISVYLATLTIWAYGSYTSRSARFPELSGQFNGHQGLEGMANRMNPLPRSALPDEPELTFIRLDRPCDDELVCTYVRCGRPSVMRAYISGVGDICSPKGPARVLKEGRRLLNGISLAWGRSKEQVSILAAVEKISMKKSDVSLGDQTVP
ncbi:hypothetical protein GQ53DRAFT_637340 [Thozetella sp. PMI_491]|nr:hypothetical protein GQ53DRAFT_637340 [Thozetella sp. PMI_491]